MNPVLVDADDFCEGNSNLDLLFRMQSFNPNFKINLFTCPGLSSHTWLESVRQISWIEMYFHTWEHSVVVRMEPKQFEEELISWEKHGYGPKGFKAPGWEMTPWAYEILKDRGWWIFDNWPPHYEGNRERPTMKCLLPDCYSKYRLVHLHIHDVCNNGMRELYFEERNHHVFNTKFYALREPEHVDAGYNFWMTAKEFVLINDIIEERESAKEMLPDNW
jgi:hypothetical protein